MSTYRIVRFRFHGPRRVMKTGLTLEEAQAHCNDPQTSSNTCTKKNKEPGLWFDGYEVES